MPTWNASTSSRAAVSPQQKHCLDPGFRDMSVLSTAFPFVACVDMATMTTTATQVVRVNADDPSEQGESRDNE